MAFLRDSLGEPRVKIIPRSLKWHLATGGERPIAPPFPLRERIE
jgi:hypothetical protein